MNGDRVLTLALALVCLLAVGSAAGSLESAVGSTPGEAVDLDYASLPVSGEGGGEIQQTYRTLAGESGPSAGVMGSGAVRARQSQVSTESSDAGGPAAESNASTLRTAALTRLLDFLQSLLARLLVVFGAIIALAVTALTARYGPRMIERYRQQSDGDERSPPSEAGTQTVENGVDTPRPQNEVTEAWHEMIRRLKLEDREPLTPRERAALARREGADANTVWSLTELFEEVQYGDAPVTEERRRRARACLDRLCGTEGEDDP
ncbi:DUF4129 domain-containing protein [Halobellus salinisoli]|uniref:DUF4129 domain-containing protein n=1 Tax=Halobellus salinisoli TaxID=3108500 RepID=UPI00300BAA35